MTDKLYSRVITAMEIAANFIVREHKSEEFQERGVKKCFSCFFYYNDEKYYTFDGI